MKSIWNQCEINMKWKWYEWNFILPSKMVQYSKRTFGCQVSNETDPNHGFCLFLKKNKQTPLCNLLKCFKKIASWILPDFSINQKPPWLGSVSFETWHPKVRFEHWNIFEGYLGAAIFEKQHRTFGQSLIFNVNFVNL